VFEHSALTALHALVTHLLQTFATCPTWRWRPMFCAGANEPYTVIFYASAVLLVKVPAWGDRAASAAQA
jgi:hypothetical protein